MLKILLLVSAAFPSALAPTPLVVDPPGVDLDGDGCADVLLPTGAPDRCRVVSGRKGTLLAEVTLAEELRGERGGLFRTRSQLTLFRDRRDGPAQILGAGINGAVLIQGLSGDTVHTFQAEGSSTRPPIVRRTESFDGRSAMIVVAAGERFQCFSEDGSTIWSVDAVARDLDATGDINGDAVGDWLVIEADDSGGGRGRATVRSGSDGSLILGPMERGESVGYIGDVDGDGVGDYAVGSPTGAAPYSARTSSDGRVRVSSGIDGRVLYELYNPSKVDAFSRFGASILHLGDVDGDGSGDFAVGGYKDDPNELEYETGSVTLFSGKDGTRLHKLFGPKSQSWFSLDRLVSPGDTNGDGVADVLVFSVRENATWVLMSGRDGSVLWVASTDKEGGLVVSRDWSSEEIDGHPADVMRIVETR